MSPQNKRGVALNTLVRGYGQEAPPHSGYYFLRDTNRYMGVLGTPTLGRNKSLLSFPNGYYSRR